MNALKWNLWATIAAVLFIALATVVFNWVLNPEKISRFRDTTLSILITMSVFGSFLYANYQAFQPTTPKGWIKVGVIAFVAMNICMAVAVIVFFAIYGALGGSH